LAEQNLFIQSNTFNNAAWIATGGTLTSGVTDPAGGTTAFSFTANSLNATLYQTVTLTATAYTESIWIKRVTGVGVINLTLDGVTLSPVTITGSWAKYTYTATPSAGAKTIGIQVVTIGDVISIYGSQIENRSAATATNITTTAILQNYIPQLMTAAINVARFDYTPVGRTALGLYVEPSSTNLQPYSQDFTNAIWSKGNVTITNAANIAPDGTQTMQLAVPNTTNASHTIIANNISVSASTAYTWSIYAKAQNYQFLNMRLDDNNVNGIAVCFNLSTGTISTAINNINSGFTSANATITSVGNGVYKCTLTGTTTATTTVVRQVMFLQSATSGSGGQSFAGNGYSGIFIWGVVFEAGSVPTSYIPTVASQVTRSADTPPLPIDTWYSTSQGTWYAQVNMASTAGTPRIVGATPSSKAPILISSQAAAMFDSTTTISTANTITANTTQKIATSWTGTTGQVCLNGGTVATGSQPTGYADLTVIGIGYNSTSSNNFINGRIANITYYPTALTSAQLQTLTT
jgi:hypothetical protein